MEIMLRVEHSSTYKMLLPFEPNVTLVGCVRRTEVSEGTIMMWADWMKVRLMVSLEVRHTSNEVGYLRTRSLISSVISLYPYVAL